MNVKAIARLILVEAAIVLGFLAFHLHAAQLDDIRVGQYDTFTRIVFEFKEPVQYQRPIVQEVRKLTVTFLNAETALTAPALQAKSKGLEFLTLTPKPPHLVAALGLPYTDFKLKTLTLTGPHRIVLDAYRIMPPADRITLKQVIIKESLQPAPSTARTQQPADAPAAGQAATPPAEKPVASQAQQAPATKIDRPLKSAPEPASIPKAAVPRPPAKQAAVPQKTPESKIRTSEATKTPFYDKPLQGYLLVVLIVIGSLIVLLIGLLLLKKKRALVSTRKDQPDEILQSTEEVLAAIDAKIKEKLQKYN